MAINSGLLTVLVAVGIPVGIVASALLRRLPFLRGIASPVEQSALRRAEVAESELLAANVTIAAQDKRIADLEKERSLASVIELVEKVSLGVDQTLEKLAALNGSLAAVNTSLSASAAAHQKEAEALDRTNDSMRVSVEAMRLLATRFAQA